MFILAKEYGKRCPKCRAAVTAEHDGFCHSCGEFFDEVIGSRWLDSIPVNQGNDQCDVHGLETPN